MWTRDRILILNDQTGTGFPMSGGAAREIAAIMEEIQSLFTLSDIISDELPSIIYEKLGPMGESVFLPSGCPVEAFKTAMRQVAQDIIHQARSIAYINGNDEVTEKDVLEARMTDPALKTLLEPRIS
jgi:hypothetical protein